MDSIASGVDLEYTELVLTTEHPLQHLDIPEMNFYARWASLFDRLCLLIRIGQTGLEKMGISFEMPVGHLNKTGLEIPFYARWALLFDRLCLALPGFAWLCLALSAN